MTGGAAVAPRPDHLPRLHVVTDDAVLARPDFLGVSEAVLAAGGPELALHVRGPHSTGAAVYDIAKRLQPAAERVGALLVVNDRVDVALALGLVGVQLGVRSLRLREVRRLVGPEALVGRSTHDDVGARSAVDDGADFVLFGNVFETPSHPGRPGRGIDALRRVVAAAGTTPLMAIGGVAVGHATAAIDAGAHGVAVLSGVWGAHAPDEAVREYLSALQR